MNRRQFVATIAGLASGLHADFGSRAGGSVEQGSTRIRPVGLQLYTIRSVLDEDFRNAMEQVAEIGYDEVEFAGYYDYSPDEMRRLLEELGLVSPATHIPLEQIREAPAKVIKRAQASGHQCVVCPYLAEEERGSLANYRVLAEEFSTFGQQCTGAGLQFAYHNHDFEFMETDSTLPYDVLLQETDPEHMKMELDLYWITEAGYDPLTYIEKNPARYPLCHVKDRGPEGAMTPVGEGTMDLAGLFRRAEFEHYFVEHDNPEHPMQSIETSHGALRDLKI